MRRVGRICGIVAVLGAALARGAPAQQARSDEIDILGHLSNSHAIEVPYWKAPYAREIELPRFAPIRVGSVAVDFSPTMHLVYLMLAALVVALVFLSVSRAVARAHAVGQPPRGFAAAMEAMVLYVRQGGV